MTENGMNPDALPPHTLVVENDHVTPVGKVALAKTTEELIALCRQAKDRRAALQALPGLIAKHVAEISSRHSNVASGQPGSGQGTEVPA
ncbi:hypothetical protein ACWC4E_01950 [Streptomyces sp. NPDC001273]|uniref:hypothetical protein n=1 Tax=unclassified Streptomyces TaxID=2593676 RepID=UPI0033F45198